MRPSTLLAILAVGPIVAGAALALLSPRWLLLSAAGYLLLLLAARVRGDA